MSLADRVDISPIYQKGFSATCRALLKVAFDDVLLDRESAFGGERPWPREAGLSENLFLIVSHSSWWDPILAGELCGNQMRVRAIGPMEEEELKRRPSLKKVGIFGTKKGDGAKAEKLILSELKRSPETVVWVHAQGQFAPNERAQPSLKSGISRWSNRPGFHRVPVVLHYSFGPRKKPIAFVRMGKPIPPSGADLSDDLEILRQGLTREASALLDRVADAHAGAAAHYEKFISLTRRSG